MTCRAGHWLTQSVATLLPSKSISVWYVLDCRSLLSLPSPEYSRNAVGGFSYCLYHTSLTQNIGTVSVPRTCKYSLQKVFYFWGQSGRLFLLDGRKIKHTGEYTARADQ